MSFTFTFFLNQYCLNGLILARNTSFEINEIIIPLWKELIVGSCLLSDFNDN